MPTDEKLTTAVHSNFVTRENRRSLREQDFSLIKTTLPFPALMPSFPQYVTLVLFGFRSAFFGVEKCLACLGGLGGDG
jgi:hypothetical protein